MIFWVNHLRWLWLLQEYLLRDKNRSPAVRTTRVETVVDLHLFCACLPVCLHHPCLDSIKKKNQPTERDICPLLYASLWMLSVYTLTFSVLEQPPDNNWIPINTDFISSTFAIHSASPRLKHFCFESNRHSQFQRDIFSYDLENDIALAPMQDRQPNPYFQSFSICLSLIKAPITCTWDISLPNHLSHVC